MVTDVGGSCAQDCVEGTESARSMSTIEDVRSAERRVQEILEALKEATAEDPDHLQIELQKATDEYAKAVRELRM